MSTDSLRRDVSRRERIAATVEDLVTSFMYFDRRKDKELLPGAIEEAVKQGEVTADEIIELFAFEFRQCLKRTENA